MAASKSVFPSVSPICEWGIALIRVRPVAIEGSSAGEAMKVVRRTSPGSEP